MRYGEELALGPLANLLGHTLDATCSLSVCEYQRQQIGPESILILVMLPKCKPLLFCAAWQWTCLFEPRWQTVQHGLWPGSLCFKVIWHLTNMYI